MKTEFKAKFLQHINKRRQDQGFTLIELLVVIIIIGILSAIALPSFLSQANKAKQSEAKQYVSSINKGQQAYFAENTKFADQITNLGIGLKTQTSNYTYNIGVPAGGATSAAAPAANSPLRSYAGAVGLVTAGEAKSTQSILCEGGAGAAPTALAPDGSAAPTCGSMTEVTK
ncbi:type IV pilin-like G/H family protein [Microcoleus vaginatus DQ-U2]|uniref:type IV pilin-like G/H family protein n=1 Tax=Microcoleus vaginatus TaxID=119532 RepID=UPI0016831A1B|nr:type IV pilin-like G/H family protein [Microcoleus sp. FACHB-DQ6]